MELTVVMESRNRSSSLNSQTGLPAAAGGAEKRSQGWEGSVDLPRRCLLNWLGCIGNGKMQTGALCSTCSLRSLVINPHAAVECRPSAHPN